MIKPSFVPVEKLKAALKISSTGEAPLVLCQHCYNELYAQFHPLKTCASCGAKPKVGSHLCRHSPDAAAVTQHLQETTGTEVIIQPSDCLCYTCYLLHLTIHTSLHAKKEEAEHSLESAMQRWREQADNSDDKLTKAILASVLFVGEHLVIEKALLLPQVCRVFLENYGVTLTDGLKSVDLNLEVGDSTVKFSSRWVLNQLIIHLNPYMQYKCIHMKYGTLLYRKEGNLLTSLSWALGAHRSKSKKCDRI